MKKTIYAAAVVLFGVNVSYAGETALDSLRASVPPSVLSGTVLPAVSKGYVAGAYSPAGAPSRPLEWIPIKGGILTMGTDTGEAGFADARPIHEVAIRTFELSKTVVTVEQYAECWVKGACTEPATGDYCNWGKDSRQLHPVNCVTWNQANQYAKFKGGRLPSESEWEYAATSGGKNQKYPWGNAAPTCEKAVMADIGGYGCGAGSTLPVLSKDGKKCAREAGQTKQGLCDMTGNVWQWVQDKYQDSYKGVPADGGAFESAGYNRVLRGGSFFDDAAGMLRTDFRFSRPAATAAPFYGIRLAR
ncbi:MAG: formylglycine-generating enzyme family protein [Elusimicrobia bacterium]|nr:formylglycine-generating enzyme family protein [Elusimicrobiota bacterium]